jgi:hypothetical protein
MVYWINIVIVSSNFGLFNRFKILNKLPDPTELGDSLDKSRKDSNAKILVEEEVV